MGQGEAILHLGQLLVFGQGGDADAADKAENTAMKKGMGGKRDALGKALSPAHMLEAEKLKDEWNARGPR